MAPRREEILIYLIKSAQRRRSASFLTNFLCQARKRLQLFFINQVKRKQLLKMLLTIMFSDERLMPKPRSIWSRPRMHVDFWEDRVLSTYNEIEFRADFRMNKKTFFILCDVLRDRLYKEDSIFRKSLSVERKVAIALYKFATPGEFRTIGNLFSVARNTACVVFHQVCEAISEELVPKIIFPSGEALEKVVEGFRDELGFPQCCGAIDGTHIPIIAPEEFKTDYYNRKGWYSVLMQAVVDSKGKFIDINIGWPGSVHDARVFGNSSLYQKAEDGTLLPNKTILIEGTEIPLLIVGDPAYPLKTYLMKAYSERTALSQEQNYFNIRLNHARVKVEHSFGRLKGRWRCLLKTNDLKLSNLLKVVGACCALHNLCENEKEMFLRDWLNLTEEEKQFQQPAVYPLQFAQRSDSKSIRNALAKHFMRQLTIQLNLENEHS